MPIKTMADTVWWRTSRAAVLQLSNVCSLFVYNADQAAIITWNASGAESVALQDRRFRFETNARIAVVLRIDSTPISGDAIGTGTRNILTVPVQPNLDDVLLNGSTVNARIVVDGEVIEFNMELNEKMAVLMTAVGKCRTVLK